MTSLNRLVAIGITVLATAMVLGCTFPTRTGYDRNIGGYKPVPGETQANDAAQAEESANKEVRAAQNTAPVPRTATATNPADSAQKALAKEPQKNPQVQTSAGVVKKAASQKSKPQPPKPRGSMEKYASEWLGAKYVYGAAGRRQTDCSGFVMQVYKGFYNIELPHNASTIYHSESAQKISRGNLKEGDLVFFGSFWKIDHVGIYLSGDRFIHASTSKGVMISPMNDKYWSPKYQGGRRFR